MRIDYGWCLIIRPSRRLVFGSILCALFLLWLGSNPQLPLARAYSATTWKSGSSAIAITPDGATLVTVNPDSNTVTLLDTTSLAVLAELAVGGDPRSVVIAPDGLLAYIACQGSDALAVIDLAAQTVKATLPVGDRPVGVAVSPDGRYLAVAELGSDQVRLLERASLKPVALFPTLDRPSGMAFTPDSARLLVSHLLDGRVTILILPPYRTYLPWISHPFASGPYPAPSAYPPTPFLKEGGVISPPFREGLWVGLSGQTLIPTWPNIAPAPAVIVNAAGTRAYLPQTMANGLGLNLQFDTTVFPKVSVVNLSTNQHQLTEHISLPETDRPVGLPWDAALARGDTELWVVNSASNDVSVINLSNPTRPTRQANLPVGDNPRGIILAPDGQTAYVNNTLAGTVSVIDAQTYAVTQVVSVTTLPLPPALLNGKRLYFSSARPELARASWISCNTCHVEGEVDGRTWILQYLGEVPPGELPRIRRNTTSLRGMIETYPLRWAAEWDEAADSEFSIRFEQFGAGLIPGDMHPTLGAPNQGRSYDLDCLALYIDSLAIPERPKISQRPLSAAEQRGQEIFYSAQTGCQLCHPWPVYTDLQGHDVGTADGPGEWFGPVIDTPTLRFLFDSAPYLHDGSAATLWEVLVIKNPADEHGVTSHLSAAELSDLIAFLMALP